MEGMSTVERMPPPRSNLPWWPTNYRTGTWAYALHRITGLALAAYLFVHIGVISFVIGQWGGLSFGQVMILLRTPAFLIFDLGLLAFLVFHSLNGVRILLFDLGIGIRSQKGIFWAVVLVTVLTVSGALATWLPHISGGG
jgi:succinate dehydrogenase / fumarate reductase cytochrome b subunit